MTGWLWTTIGVLGLGGTILAVLVVMGFWPVIFGTKIGRAALAGGAVLLAVVGLYAKARQAGRLAERARLKAITEQEVGISAAERRRIDALPDDAVDLELAAWDRRP